MLKKVLFEILKNKLLILLLLAFDCLAFFNVQNISLLLVEYFSMFFLVLLICDNIRDDLTHGGMIFLLNSNFSFYRIYMIESICSIIFCSQIFILFLINNPQDYKIIITFIERMFCFFGFIKLFFYLMGDKLVLVYVSSLLTNMALLVAEKYISLIAYNFILAIIFMIIFNINKLLFYSKSFRLKITG